MKFRIECVDAEGRTRRDTITAESIEAAAAKAKANGVTLTSIVPDDDAIPSPPKPVLAKPPAPKRVPPTPAAAPPNHVRGSWPLTLLLTLGAILFSGCPAALLGRLGLIVAILPLALLFRSDWRKTCFEFVRLNKKMTTIQQFVLLGTTAFFFAAVSTIDPVDSSTEVAKEEGSTLPFSPTEGPPPASTTPSRTQTTQARPAASSSEDTPSIPPDVTHSVINEEKIPGIKRSVDIRLNKRVSKETLTTIAKAVKQSDSLTYERTFIGYYLPDMEVDAGYWATTHYNPSLDVRILGLPADAAAQLSAKADDANRDEIGRWLDESFHLLIVIYRENGELLMEFTYKDGSSSTIQEIVESKSNRGRRFDKLGGSTAGDHRILNSNGDLQQRDAEGVISTAKSQKVLSSPARQAVE